MRILQRTSDTKLIVHALSAPVPADSALLSPDGKTLLLITGPTAVLVDVTTGRPIGTTLTHEAAIQAALPAARVLTTADISGLRW